MSNISIDKNLNPGSEEDFELELTLFGETISRVFGLKVPNAPLLASKQSEKIKLTVENKDEYKTVDNNNNKEYTFNKFKKFTINISPTRYKFLVILNANKVPGDLAAEDDVVITCAAAGFNQVPAVVLPSDSGRSNYLYLSISTSNQPSKNQDNSTVGTVKEIKKRIKRRKITIDASVFKNTLVSEVSTPPKKGSVEDIIVFAYKQFDGENKASIKYKLMSDDSEINLKTPPQRSSVVQYRGQYTTSKLFQLNDQNGNKILCFVAIARYIYDGEKWKGDWLQTNEQGDVIWGRAGG